MVGGMDLVNQLSVREHELIPVSYTVGGINHGQLELLGGLLVNISLGDREHQELCYIAKGVLIITDDFLFIMTSHDDPKNDQNDQSL